MRLYLLGLVLMAAAAQAQTSASGASGGLTVVREGKECRFDRLPELTLDVSVQPEAQLEIHSSEEPYVQFSLYFSERRPTSEWVAGEWSYPRPIFGITSDKVRGKTAATALVEIDGKPVKWDYTMQTYPGFVNLEADLLPEGRWNPPTALVNALSAGSNMQLTLLDQSGSKIGLWNFDIKAVRKVRELADSARWTCDGAHKA
jgi:hypothetical protein